MAIDKTAPAAPVRAPLRKEARPVAAGGFEAALTAVLGERPPRDAPLRVAFPQKFSSAAPAGQAGPARPEGPPAGQAKAVRPDGPPTARGAIILTPEILLSDTPAPAAGAKPVTPKNPPVARGAIILTPEAPDSPASTGGEATPASVAEAASPAVPSPMAATASASQAAARSVQDGPPAQARTNAPSSFTADEEALLLAAAKSVKQPPKRVLPANASPLDARSSEVAASVSADPDFILKTAAAQIGRRYASGGETPRQGFDCSGLTSYVFAKSGLELPRSSREQFRHGQAVKREELKKGDLVFFGKKGVNHVGVYLEDGKFIHAASAAGSVKMGSLDDPVWDKLYAGARRII